MQKFDQLEFGKYYHIFNRGINSCDLFRNADNYLYFQHLYEKHIDTIAETYAWCLMKNHFHLLLRIKDVNEVLPVNTVNPDRVGKSASGSIKVKQPYRYFSDFFNAYTQAFNKVHNRHGGLFETPFQRIEVDNTSYFRHLVCYIHQNPVKHGFTDWMAGYPWSSYLNLISINQTKLKRDVVIGWFNSQTDFIEFHSKEQDFERIKNIIIE